MFKNIFSFDGRIRRLEYGISLIIFYLVFVASEEFLIIKIIILPLFWVLLAQGAKRCHDMGNNGWWQIIPLYGLWMLFDEGQKRSNNYGKDPKVKTNLPKVIDSSEVTTNETRKASPDTSLVISGISDLEVRNVNYSNLQEILRQLRSLNFVNGLSHEILEATANITVKHAYSSQYLVDEFIKIVDGIKVLEVTQGKIIIKIK